MSRYVSESYFETVRTLPVALAQTELKRENSLVICRLPLALNQTLELRSLTLHIIKILTPGVKPFSEVTVNGIASVGLQFAGMATGMIGSVNLENVGSATWNPYEPVLITAPGTYQVTVRNHTNNVDMAIAVTGSVKIFS